MQQEKTLYISSKMDETGKWIIVVTERVWEGGFLQQDKVKTDEYPLTEESESIALLIAKIKVDSSINSLILEEKMFDSHVMTNHICSKIQKFLKHYKKEILGERESDIFYDKESKQHVIILGALK